MWWHISCNSICLLISVDNTDYIYYIYIYIFNNISSGIMPPGTESSPYHLITVW